MTATLQYSLAHQAYNTNNLPIQTGMWLCFHCIQSVSHPHAITCEVAAAQSRRPACRGEETCFPPVGDAHRGSRDAVALVSRAKRFISNKTNPAHNRGGRNRRRTQWPLRTDYMVLTYCVCGC